MKLFDETKQVIKSLGHCKAAYTIAWASASACNQRYGISLLRMSIGLDYRNKQLVLRMFNIINEPDFSNKSQDEMLNWLDEGGWLENIPTENQ